MSMAEEILEAAYSDIFLATFLEDHSEVLATFVIEDGAETITMEDLIDAAEEELGLVERQRLNAPARAAKKLGHANWLKKEVKFAPNTKQHSPFLRMRKIGAPEGVDAHVTGKPNPRSMTKKHSCLCGNAIGLPTGACVCVDADGKKMVVDMRQYYKNKKARYMDNWRKEWAKKRKGA